MPPISIAMLLLKYAALLAESSIYTTKFVSRYASHLYRDAFAKVGRPLGRKSYIHPQFVSRYASHFYRDTFAEVLGSGVVGTLLKKVGQSQEYMKSRVFGPFRLEKTKENPFIFKRF